MTGARERARRAAWPLADVCAAAARPRRSDPALSRHALQRGRRSRSQRHVRRRAEERDASPGARVGARAGRSRLPVRRRRRPRLSATAADAVLRRRSPVVIAKRRRLLRRSRRRRAAAPRSSSGRYHVNRKASLVQVTDFADRLDLVAAYLDAAHIRVNRQIRIHARVFEVIRADSAPVIGRR